MIGTRIGVVSALAPNVAQEEARRMSAARKIMATL